MNRRSFFKMLGFGALGAAVAKLLPAPEFTMIEMGCPFSTPDPLGVDPCTYPPVMYDYGFESVRIQDKDVMFFAGDGVRRVVDFDGFMMRRGWNPPPC